MRRTLFAFGICLLLAAVGGAVPSLSVPRQTPTGTTRTVLEGVFTEEQANRGKTAYERQCQGCHGPNLDGSGVSRPLRSQAFLDIWREEPLSYLYDYMQTTMPVDDPGSLTTRNYVDLLAHILRANELPSGRAELTGEQLTGILLVGKEGPRPLPPDVPVRVVGCLERQGNEWSLSNSPPLKRIRPSDKTTAEELERSGTLPFGSAVYRLAAVPEQAISLQGERVQVKGMLTSPESVSVKSLDKTGVSCSRR